MKALIVIRGLIGRDYDRSVIEIKKQMLELGWELPVFLDMPQSNMENDISIYWLEKPTPLGAGKVKSGNFFHCPKCEYTMTTHRDYVQCDETGCDLFGIRYKIPVYEFEPLEDKK